MSMSRMKQWCLLRIDNVLLLLIDLIVLSR